VLPSLTHHCSVSRAICLIKRLELNVNLSRKCRSQGGVRSGWGSLAVRLRKALRVKDAVTVATGGGTSPITPTIPSPAEVTLQRRSKTFHMRKKNPKAGKPAAKGRKIDVREAITDADATGLVAGEELITQAETVLPTSARARKKRRTT